MSLMSQAQESKYAFLNDGDLSIEGAVLIWRNFEGRPNKFVPQGGRRSFNLVLAPAVAEELKELGWNIKSRPPRDEDDDPLCYTEIIVKLDSKYPPKAFLCSEQNGRKKMIELDESTIKLLDSTEMANVDLIIHPYEHGRDVGSRIKGYLRSIYATQAASYDFGGKYSDYEVAAEHPSEDDDALPF